MAAGAATGQAVVTRADRFENPYVGMSHSDHVAPCRQRLLCARQMPAEQLDQYQQEQIQHRIAGRSRQSDVEPKLLDGGRAYIVGGVIQPRPPQRIEEGRNLRFAAALDNFRDIVDLDGIPDAP